MASITIVSGCPGSGKTTLCRILARERTRGLHLVTDAFYTFPAHPIDPSLPESREQNTAIVRAFCRAAGAFAQAGYDVFVDGVVGPWFLPVVAQELASLRMPVSYVVLRADLSGTLARARGRDEVVSPRVVRQMHASFSDLGELEGHVIETDVRTPGALARLVRDSGDVFQLELSRWASEPAPA